MFKLVRRLAVAFAVVFPAGVNLAWTTPTNLGPDVNSSYEDNEPGVNPSGNTLYFTSKRDGNYDVWQTIKSGGSWQPATKTPVVNSSSYDGNPALIQSTYLEMYITSGRGATMDIYQSLYRSGSWTTPSRLPSPVNTNNSEYGCGLFRRNGRLTMVFASNRPGGKGQHDLWETEWRSGSGWQTPRHVSAPSSSANDLSPTVTLDGSTMYFASNRSGGFGSYDLYVSTWSGSAWGVATNLGPVVNTSYGDVHPGVSTDGQKLYFGSGRPGGQGGTDIWVTSNEQAIEPQSMGKIKALFR